MRPCAELAVVSMSCQVRAIEDRLRFLQWRKLENETRMRQLMSAVRTQQVFDAQECEVSRREALTDKYEWATGVIQDELEKPLQVSKVRHTHPIRYR